MTRCEMDLRPGGKFLWVWGKGANEHRLPGEFLVVDAPHRLVYVDTGDTPSHITVTFTQEKDGRTKVAMLGRLGNNEMRDEILAGGYTEGTELGYVRLDALLLELG